MPSGQNRRATGGTRARDRLPAALRDLCSSIVDKCHRHLPEHDPRSTAPIVGVPNEAQAKARACNVSASFSFGQPAGCRVNRRAPARCTVGGKVRDQGLGFGATVEHLLAALSGER